MDNKDIENTKEFDNLEEIMANPTKPAIEIVQNDIKQINDINENLDSIKETIESIDKISNEVQNVKEKKKLKDKWKSLSKKKKIIIFIGVILLILVTTLIMLFVNHDKKAEKKVVKEKDVIVIKDNYRYENGSIILLDKDDKDIGKYECKNKDENNCYVAFYDIDEYLDTTRTLDEDGNLKEQRTPIIDDRYVYIYDNEEDSKNSIILLYDIKNEEKLGEYTSVKFASSDSSIVKDKSGSYGVIKINDKNVEKVIDFNYDNISFFDDKIHSYYMVNDNGRNYLMNSSSKIISKAISMNIVNYNDKYIVGVDDSKKYYLYDYNNKMIFDDSYDYIKVYDDYVALVTNNKLYIKYYDENKLHEIGYTIDAKYNYYNEVNIINEDGIVIDSYVPFNVVKNATTLTVTINDVDNVINLKEGEISKNTDYINYFDGVLYIYNDLEKKNLVGEYKCTNQNVLSSSSTNFENCFITRDVVKQDNDMTFYESKGLIPIINNRYVFIQDNPNALSDNNRNIVLYDLNDKKILSKYLTVNSNLNSESEMPSYIIDSDIKIIAQNKSNKYGVLSINDNKLTSLVPFNYVSIENIGNYYLAYDGTSYTLFNRNGEDLLPVKKVTNKIRGYNTNYIKVLEGSSYHIYDYEGNKITESIKSGFKYIELYENYFVGVSSDNKLNIYSYKYPDKPLILKEGKEDSIQLKSDKYYGDGQLSFKVVISGNTVVIYTLNENEKYDTSSVLLADPSASEDGENISNG